MSSSSGSTTQPSSTNSTATEGPFGPLMAAAEDRATTPIGNVDVIAINATPCLTHPVPPRNQFWVLRLQLLALTEETDALRKLTHQNNGFTKTISDYKKKSHEKTIELREKLTEMSAEHKNFEKKWREKVDKELGKVLAATDPYVRSGQAPEEQGTTMSRIAKLYARTTALNAALASNREISDKVMQHHKMLDGLEEKQRDAMTRYEEITRVQNLYHDIPQSDPLHPMATLPQFLLALSMSKSIDPAYTKVFKQLEQRSAALVAQIRYNKTDGHEQKTENSGISMKSMESMSNGEIDLKSLVDPEEHPLDSLRVKTPEPIN